MSDWNQRGVRTADVTFRSSAAGRRLSRPSTGAYREMCQTKLRNAKTNCLSYLTIPDRPCNGDNHVSHLPPRHPEYHSDFHDKSEIYRIDQTSQECGTTKVDLTKIFILPSQLIKFLPGTSYKSYILDAIPSLINADRKSTTSWGDIHEAARNVARKVSSSWMRNFKGNKSIPRNFTCSNVTFDTIKVNWM